MLKDTFQAEEAAQEVFIKAYQALKSFQGNSSISTWLYRIASNHCKDLLRKKTRQKTESLDALLEDPNSAGKEPSFNPVEARDAAESVERILSVLTMDERLILTLREAQGLSYQEIAETLGCSLDAVKARLRRARESVEEKLRHFSQIKNV